MKTTRLFALVAGFLLSMTTVKAIRPVSTATFVNPCQPFGIITAIPNTYGCFSYSATNAGSSDPNAYYSWNFGDGTTVNGTFVYHCYNTVTVATVYSVTVSYISPALCGPLPTQTTYTLLLNPPGQGACVHNPPSYSLSATSVTVWTGFAIPEILYSLSYGDGTPATNLITHKYANCGNYVVKIQDWDMNFPQNVCYSYLALNIACPTQTTTGVEEFNKKENSPLVFPNPAKDVLTISAGTQIAGIKIVDLSGRICVEKSDVNMFTTNVDLSGLKPGVYFLRTENINTKITFTRFVKE